MIPEGHTIEDIKIREQIIRDFQLLQYYNWILFWPEPEKYPSRSRNQEMQIRNHSSVLWLWSMSWQGLERSRWLWAWEDELSRKSSTVLPQSQANRTKKASCMRCLTFAPYAWRRFTPWGVMRCRRGLRTTHYIVLPRLTDYAAKICSFSLFAKPVLINFKKLYQNGYSIFEFHCL